MAGLRARLIACSILILAIGLARAEPQATSQPTSHARASSRTRPASQTPIPRPSATSPSARQATARQAAGSKTPAPGALRWTDLAPAVRDRLASNGLSEAAFPAFLDRERRQTDRRLRDGSFDQVVYFALQSTRISTMPVVEPALSARTFVEELGRARIPSDAAARLDALAAALIGATPTPGPTPQAGADDARLALFRQVIAEAGFTRAARAGRSRAATTTTLAARLRTEYIRAMGFLYEKEFVAPRAADSREATATLYHARAHSTDTQIEAGFAVAEALATLRALSPESRITRLLIVGPGLDLAPRTGLLEDAPPQSYQPFAVADTLLALGMAEREALRIDIVDINPLVVRHFSRLSASAAPASIVIESGLADDAHTRLNEDFRRYVRQWGAMIRWRQSPLAADAREAAAVDAEAAAPAAPVSRGRRLSIDPIVTRAISARRANIVTDRLAATAAYDLIVITNVLPYLDDTELLVALSNIAAALAPGGAFIHNEPRRLLLATGAAIGLPAVQSRTVQLASPAGGQPLFDTVVLHRKP